MRRREMLKLCMMVSFLGCLFFSCASSNPYAKIDEAVSRVHYQDGMHLIEKDKKKIYKDPILYYLDKGMIAHYAQEYPDSTELLQEGERAIEEAFTKSVTREIGSYILNDKTKEYEGEDYEDIYINAFNALNYYYKNDIEGALVEIRQMNNKLEVLSAKYEKIMTDLQNKAIETGDSVPPNPEGSTKFSNSALARYLGMLFYRANGDYDDARIDHEQLQVAFANAPEVYAYPLPASIDQELDIPAGKARLNILGFSGLSPVKQAEVIHIPLPGPRWIKIALPVMVYRPSQVQRIEVEVHNGQTFNLELLEDMEAVARETFKEKVNLIYLKSIIRATMKGVASSALGIAADNVEDETTGLILSIASIGAQVFAEASEQADLRLSRYFPGKAFIGGITLDPGVYSLKINYYNAHGSLLTSVRQENVVIQQNKLNLVEAVCLK